MLKIEITENGAETEVVGDLSAIINELATLTVATENITSDQITFNEFNKALELSKQAQRLAHSGMSIKDTEQILNHKIDMEKSKLIS